MVSSSKNMQYTLVMIVTRQMIFGGNSIILSLTSFRSYGQGSFWWSSTSYCHGTDTKDVGSIGSQVRHFSRFWSGSGISHWNFLYKIRSCNLHYIASDDSILLILWHWCPGKLCWSWGSVADIQISRFTRRSCVYECYKYNLMYKVCE